MTLLNFLLNSQRLFRSKKNCIKAFWYTNNAFNFLGGAEFSVWFNSSSDSFSCCFYCYGYNGHLSYSSTKKSSQTSRGDVSTFKGLKLHLQQILLQCRIFNINFYANIISFSTYLLVLKAISYQICCSFYV